MYHQLSTDTAQITASVVFVNSQFLSTPIGCFDLFPLPVPTHQTAMVGPFFYDVQVVLDNLRQIPH